MTSESLLSILAIGGLCFICFTWPAPDSSKPPAGTKEVPTHSAWHLYKSQEDVDGIVTIKSPDTGASLGNLKLRDSQLFEPDGSQGPRNQFVTEYERQKYLVEVEHEFGGWAGVYFGEGSRIQAGVRYSPVKLFYRVVVPEAVVSEEVAGAGVSFRLPTDNHSSFWHSIGIGVWCVVPFDHGDPDVCVGLSFGD